MNDLKQKCQFTAHFAALPPNHPSKYSVCMVVLHYPYTAPVAEFYANTSEIYLGTMEFEEHKVHILWDTKPKRTPTQLQKDQMRNVVTRFSTQPGYSVNEMIRYQIKAHKRAQALEAQQNSTQENE